jgi:L-lactate utilization protein LutC
MNEKIARTMEGLRKNKMEAYFAETAEEALEKIKELCPEGAKIASGGSETLAQIGAVALFRSGKYEYFDRYAPGADAAEEALRAFNADVYFCSSNAITEDGELYNVDGAGNRVSALVYGPKSVVIVAGVNKLVPDMDAAVRRVEDIAAPLKPEDSIKRRPAPLPASAPTATARSVSAACTSAPPSSARPDASRSFWSIRSWDIK